MTTHNGTGENDVMNFSENVHNIMNGIEETVTTNMDEDRSPKKKRPGSSKVSSRQNTTVTRRVSPQDM